jgi:hypothetical protein
MAHVPQHKRLRRVFLLLSAGILFITLLALLPLAIAPPLSPITSTLSAFASYDPATYGIPYQIAGFKILAVRTSENTACIPSGMMRITVQSSQPDVQSFLANSGDSRVVSETLRQIPSLSGINFNLEFIGPAPWNPERFLSSVAEWNNHMKNGCVKLGGPAIIITPTPDPFAPYDPATYGIPEIVAGYRIVIVQTAETNPCIQPDEMRLTIQAVDPSPDNPMVPREGGDILFELEKLKPGIKWGLAYIMPVPFDREQFVRQQNEAMKNGCVKLGGPEFTLTPSDVP